MISQKDNRTTVSDFDAEARSMLRDIGLDPKGLTTGDLAPLRNLFAKGYSNAGIHPELTTEIYMQMGRANEALIRLSNAVTARAMNLEDKSDIENCMRESKIISGNRAREGYNNPVYQTSRPKPPPAPPKSRADEHLQIALEMARDSQRIAKTAQEKAERVLLRAEKLVARLESKLAMVQPDIKAPENEVQQ